MQEENSYAKPPGSSDSSARRSRRWFRSRRRPAGEAHGLKPRELVRRQGAALPRLHPSKDQTSATGAPVTGPHQSTTLMGSLERLRQQHPKEPPHLGPDIERGKCNPTSDHPEERRSRVSKGTLYELATALGVGPVELVKPD